MSHSELFAPLVGLVVLQVLGLAVALATRATVGSAWQGFCQRLFYGCFVLVGAATLLSFVAGLVYGLACGTNLACMALTAVWDFNETASPAT
jgi:hypothetical protein